jgi:3-methylcrotonyl-CoA carboxylase beta subunit
MGGEQAATVLGRIRRQAMTTKGEDWSEADEDSFKADIKEQYTRQSGAYFSSARLWDDGIIDPVDSRAVLGASLAAAIRAPLDEEAPYGIFRT